MLFLGWFFCFYRVIFPAQGKYFIRKVFLHLRFFPYFPITDCLGEFRDVRELIKIHYLLVRSFFYTCLYSYSLVFLGGKTRMGHCGHLHQNSAGLRETCNEEALRANVTILCDGFCHQISLLSLLQSLVKEHHLILSKFMLSFQALRCHSAFYLMH